MKSARPVSWALWAAASVALAVSPFLPDRLYLLALTVVATCVPTGVVLWCIPSAVLIYRIGYRDGVQFGPRRRRDAGTRSVVNR